MQLTSFLASGGYDPLAPDTFGQALWTLIIFGLSVPFIWKIVLGPIVMALEERDGHAKEAILAAETAKEEAERVRAEVEVSLGEARAESAREMAEARERAPEVAERLQEDHLAWSLAPLRRSGSGDGFYAQLARSVSAFVEDLAAGPRA